MPIIGSPVTPDPEVLILDPVTEDAANSELVISTGLYGLLEHHYPQPPVVPQWASSVDTEGSRLGSVKHDNRQIQITIDVDGLDALRDIQAKLGKLHREGGTLQRTLGDSTVIVFDVLTVEGYDPSFDITYTMSGLTTVSFTLTCLPYGRGTEEDLGDNVETTLPWLIFTETGVKGDMPALGRLVIDNDESGVTQERFWWGMRSRYYDSASTAALFYQAESCALITATAGTRAGASGSGNTVAQHLALPDIDIGAPAQLLYIGASATAQTHVGTYRVLVRTLVPVGVANVSLRLAYRPYIGSATVTGEYADVTAIGGDLWDVVDLGLVSIPPARRGTQGWLGWLEGGSTTVNDDVYIDWIALVPVDEGYGEVVQGVAAGSSIEVAHDGVTVSTSGGYWGRVDHYEGDYLRVPPAGAEARTVQIMTKGRRVSGDAGGSGIGDTIGDVSAHLYVTPRYLVIPSA